jgi:hypothetical protein
VGLISIAGIETATRSSNEKDLWAALIITGMLLLIGIMIVVLSLKSRTRVHEDINGVLTCFVLAHMINMDDHSDAGGDVNAD